MKRVAPFAAVSILILTSLTLQAKAPGDKNPGKPILKTIPGVPSLISSEFGGKTFDQWKTDLIDADASVRAEAILAITFFGPAAAEAVPIILSRCLDKDASPRVKAVMALTIMEIREQDVPKVIDALAYRVGFDDQSIIRYQAAVAIEQRFAGHEHARTDKVVTNMLRGSNDSSAWEIRRTCLVSLRFCGRDPKTGPEKRVVNAMVRSLKDATARVRVEAAIGLGVLGRPADPALLKQAENALQGVLRDRDKSVGIWAQVSLMALADKVADQQLETLAKGMGSSESRIRVQTTRALGVMGERAKLCLPVLLRALEDKDADVTFEAIGALLSVGSKNPKVIDALTEMSKNKEVGEGIREAAKLAVKQATEKPLKK